ncbi:hypothetical protein SH467x_004008 [Pirellulaceae bacterium SH467]
MTKFLLNLVLVFLLCDTLIGQDAAILQSTLSNIATFAFTDSLPNADRIELYTLSNLAIASENELEVERLPERFLLAIGGYGAKEKSRFYVGVDSRVTIRGTDCKNIVQAWRELEFQPNRTLCHTPPYGIRFYRDDKLIFETTVCWECHNFHMPRVDAKTGTAEMQLYGFKNDGKAKKLLATLQKHLPLPKQPKP